MWLDRCTGFEKRDDGRIRFSCPINPDHVVVGRPVGALYHILCLGDCDNDAVLDALGLTQSDLVLHSSIPVAATETPAETFSETPAVTASNGAIPNGHEPPARSVGSWQLEVGYCLKGCIDAVPANQREALASHEDQILIDDIVQKPLSMIRDHQRPVWPVPEELTETEIEEEIRRLAERAIAAFKEEYLPNGKPDDYPVPATTGGYQLPAVGEMDREPVDAFDAYQTILADQHDYTWAGLLRTSCTLVLTALIGAGKTTLAMNVVRGWALGEEVLGRLCKQSKSLVVVSPKEWEAWAECIGFWQLRGVVYLIPSHKTHFDDGREQAVWFQETMRKLGCQTFVLDTMFDFFGMPPNARGDSNRIALAEQTPILEVVRLNNWSGLVTGHAPKSEAQAVVARDPEEAFAGHTAWTAQHRMRAVIRRKAKGANAFITGRGGYGDAGILEEQMLLFDEQTRLVRLGGKFSEYLGEAACPSVVEALGGAGWCSRSELITATGKGKSWVHAGCKWGLKNGSIKWNERKGRAAKYALPDEPNDPEQGTLLG